MRLDELAALDPAQRREVAKELRQVAETFADVPDGKTTSQVLDVLAHLLDGGLTGAICAPKAVTDLSSTTPDVGR